MIGYKFMRKNYCCKEFRFEVGKEYTIKGYLKLNKNGFHFCLNPFDCYQYYNNIDGDKHLFIIETLGDVINYKNNYATSIIRILEEITDIEKLIEDNLAYVNWNNISKYQKLSERFIEKYKDKLNLKHILEYQELTEDFKNKLNNQ